MAFCNKNKMFLALLLLWSAYVVIGVFAFSAVEGSAGPEKENGERRWSYGNSFWFTFVLLATIGYGDLYPVTLLGKVLCVVYAFFGIPITILFLRLIGQYIFRGQRWFVTAIETRCTRKFDPPNRLNGKCFVLGLIYLLLLLLAGAGVQMWVEDEWSYEGSIYFYAMSFTTVGFGDMLPSNKYIVVAFIFLQLTAVSSMLHAAASMTLVRRVTARVDDNDDERDMHANGKDVQANV